MANAPWGILLALRIGFNLLALAFVLFAFSQADTPYQTITIALLAIIYFKLRFSSAAEEVERAEMKVAIGSEVIALKRLLKGRADQAPEEAFAETAMEIATQNSAGLEKASYVDQAASVLVWLIVAWNVLMAL